MMQKAIEKAHALIEALEYIQKYAGKIIVIKFGGSVMDDPTAMKNILTDVVFMSSSGMKPVIVHGGGKAISKAMEERNLEVQFVQGRRYTDQRTLTVVEHVLCNEINADIVKTLNSLGSRALPLHTLSSCVLFGEKLFLEEEGRKIDIGQVGKINRVGADVIRSITNDHIIPVIAPIAVDHKGGKLNCNADTAAGEIAAELRAEKFVVISDTHGIRADVKDPESMIPEITEDEIKQRIADGTISSGMLPKVEACCRALDGGVKRTHIIDGNIDHALLLEIFSRKGVGTLIQK